MSLSNPSPEEIETDRRITVAEKLRLIAELNRAETERQKEEIRARYGDISDEEMRMRLGVLRLGRETMVKVFGWGSGRAWLVMPVSAIPWVVPAP